MIGTALEEEGLTRPGTGDQIQVSIVVKVHNMWAKANASPAGDASVLLALLELHGCGQSGVGICPFIATNPEDAVPELAHEQILHTVTVNVRYARGCMSHIGVNGFTACLESNRRCQLPCQGWHTQST